jgi:hypothetical protein
MFTNNTFIAELKKIPLRDSLRSVGPVGIALLFLKGTNDQAIMSRLL